MRANVYDSPDPDGPGYHAYESWPLQAASLKYAKGIDACLRGLGMVLATQERFEEAIVHYNRADAVLRAEPNGAKVHGDVDLISVIVGGLSVSLGAYVRSCRAGFAGTTAAPEARGIHARKTQAFRTL